MTKLNIGSSSYRWALPRYIRTHWLVFAGTTTASPISVVSSSETPNHYIMELKKHVFNTKKQVFGERYPSWSIDTNQMRRRRNDSARHSGKRRGKRGITAMDS